MSSTSSGTEDLTDYHQREEGSPGAPGRYQPAVRRRRRLATGATVAGGLLVGAALRSARGARRPLAAVAGLALLALGLRERLGGRGVRHARERRESGTTTPSGAVPGRPGQNPRGTADEPNVPARTPPDEGSIRFTEHQDQEPRPKPDLEEGPHDPRVDRGEGEVTVDLSTASMADEESEAAGPKPEQGYPAQVEDTEPDRSPPADVSHVIADQPAPEDWRGNEPATGDEGSDFGAGTDRPDADGSG